MRVNLKKIDLPSTQDLLGIGCPMSFKNYLATLIERLVTIIKLKNQIQGYEVYFDQMESIKIGDTLEEIYAAFEDEETGRAVKLKKFIKKAKDNYNIAVKDLVYWSGISPLEQVTPTAVKKVGYFLSTIKKRSLKNLKNERLAQIL